MDYETKSKIVDQLIKDFEQTTIDLESDIFYVVDEKSKLISEMEIFVLLDLLKKWKKHNTPFLHEQREKNRRRNMEAAQSDWWTGKNKI